MQFHTEAELRSMPLGTLRNLDVHSSEEEQMVQKVINSRMADLPPSSPIYRGDVPEIQNQEQEQEWQKVIDERTAKLKPKMETPDAGPEVLNPSALDFDPTKVDLAPDEKPVEAKIRKSPLQRRIEEIEKPTMGAPITFSGGIPKALKVKK